MGADGMGREGKEKEEREKETECDIGYSETSPDDFILWREDS